MAKPLPKQNPLEETTHISLFVSFEHVLIEVEKSSNHEHDSEDSLLLCEGERSLGLSIEFQPLTSNPLRTRAFKDKWMVARWSGE
jgi:hypothetical protein